MKNNKNDLNKSKKSHSQTQNHFPEESLSDQRELPYEGDDFKGAMEDGAGNEVNPDNSGLKQKKNRKF